MNRSIYQQGIRAHANDEDLTACPYEGYARLWWVLGWECAETESKGDAAELPGELERR